MPPNALDIFIEERVEAVIEDLTGKLQGQIYHCRRYYNLIGRITVEIARQSGGLYRDFRGKFDKANTWIAQSGIKPFLQAAW
jgi:hypothetical protein